MCVDTLFEHVQYIKAYIHTYIHTDDNVFVVHIRIRALKKRMNKKMSSTNAEAWSSAQSTSIQSRQTKLGQDIECAAQVRRIHYTSLSFSLFLSVCVFFFFSFLLFVLNLFALDFSVVAIWLMSLNVRVRFFSFKLFLYFSLISLLTFFCSFARPLHLQTRETEKKKKEKLKKISLRYVRMW